MKENSSEEWEKFQLTGKPDSLHYYPFIHVSHVTHRENAITIIRNKAIQSSTVSNNTQLNIPRLEVVWLSPNSWGNGFRYGNVRFKFDCENLFANKSIYWAGLKNYRNTACCFFITERSKDDPIISNCTPYNPINDNGPWRYNPKNNKHYSNHSITLEIIIDKSSPLNMCDCSEFVNHHSDQCSINTETCPDRGISHDLAGAQFISALVSRSIEVPNNLLTIPQENIFIPNSSLKGSCEKLWSDLYRFHARVKGSIDQNNELSPALARAILSAYAVSRDSQDIRKIMSLFQDFHAVVISCASVIADKFQITHYLDLGTEEWLENPEQSH